MHHNNNEDKHDDGYNFIEETIKPTSTKRTVFNYILKMSVSGIAFGMCACLAFYVFSPWLSEVFKRGRNDIVIEQDESISDDSIKYGENYDTEKFIETFNDIHNVANEAASSILSIKPYSYDETKAKLSFDSVAGVIIAEDEREYYVLSLGNVCDEAEFWRANIRNNRDCNIGLIARDKNTGLAIFRIIKEGLEPEVANSLKVTKLGNSNMISPGSISIAVGDIFGKHGGTDYGIIESNDRKELIPDIHYSIFSVDMFPVASGGGFLFNVYGELTGIFLPEHNSKGEVKAVGISELKPVIELLANDQKVPYIGIFTDTISETVSDEKDIPYGVYVLQVQRDSPAMEAGITNGDIITSIGDTEIKTVQDYEQKLLELKPGETVRINAKRKGVEGYVDMTFQLLIKTKE